MDGTSAGEKERLDSLSKKMTCIVVSLILSEGKGYSIAGKICYGFGNGLYKVGFVFVSDDIF